MRHVKFHAYPQSSPNFLRKPSGIYVANSFCNSCQTVSMNNTSIQKHNRLRVFSKILSKSFVKTVHLEIPKLPLMWSELLFCVALRRKHLWKAWLVAGRVPRRSKEEKHRTSLILKLFNGAFLAMSSFLVMLVGYVRLKTLLHSHVTVKKQLSRSHMLCFEF